MSTPLPTPSDLKRLTTRSMLAYALRSAQRVMLESGWLETDFNVLELASSFVKSDSFPENLDQQALVAASQLCAVPIANRSILRTTSALRNLAWACANAVCSCQIEASDYRDLIANAAARAAGYAITTESEVAALRDFEHLVNLFELQLDHPIGPSFDPTEAGPLGKLV